MQEIVKLVVDKTGVSPEIAAKAVEVISGYLKSKMPAVGGQLDSLLKGGGGAGDVAGKIAGGLGDMFGKK